MQRSSETIGALATALAKAQSDLTNPEKSLVATLPASAREKERSFRYASLASGLDIARKCLGRHEIAAIQSTTIDRDSGLVRLTTTLAHSSGEWMSSEWPVCPISDTASPQRMGTALTYARRYALFTLIGIAGEDDLDAPELAHHPVTTAPTQSNASNSLPKANVRPRETEWLKSEHIHHAQVITLAPEQSASLSQNLLVEVAALETAEQAATWAMAALKHKNSLTSVDAKLVEDAFERRLSALQSLEEKTSETAPINPGRPQEHEAEPESDPDLPTGIDKSVLPLGTPRRYRNQKHLRFVAEQPCLVCGRQPSDAHHLRFAQPSALGRKSSDEFTVPLCRVHHGAVHRVGDERAWWKSAGIDPLAIASKLWNQTRGGAGRGKVRREPSNANSTPTAPALTRSESAAITVPLGGMPFDEKRKSK